MQMIRKLGTFVEFSVFAEPTTLDWSIIGDKKELDVRGSHISPYTYPFVIEHMTDGTLKTNGRGHKDVLSGSMGRGIPLRRRRGGGYQSRISVWRLSDTVNYVALHRGGEL